MPSRELLLNMRTVVLSLCRELRNVSGCSIHLSAYPDVPRCVKKGEEVSQLAMLRC